MLTLVNLLNYLDRNVVFAVFEPIKSDLKLSDAQLGWLGSAYIVVLSLAALPLGVIGDLRSRRGKIFRGTHGVTRNRKKEKAKNRKKPRPEADSSDRGTPARPV